MTVIFWSESINHLVDQRRDERNIIERSSLEKKNRLTGINWTVGSKHSLWYKSCCSVGTCYSNATGLQGAVSRPLQDHLQRNTELLLRNLLCVMSAKVCLPDNSKYSPQYFTFWRYQCVISFINCRYNDTGHFSRLTLFFNLTLSRLMSYIYIYIYIYGAPILDVSRSHTTTQHSR